MNTYIFILDSFKDNNIDGCIFLNIFFHFRIFLKFSGSNYIFIVLCTTDIVLIFIYFSLI